LLRQRWTTGDFDILFQANPPTIPTAPTANEARLIARRLVRSTGAVRSQWDDARSLVLGNQTAASRELRTYVQERWLEGPTDREAKPALKPG
jgi:hypothetical protein